MSSPRGEPPVCYVSSEHCYQKPGASWEKGEEQEKERPTVMVKQEHSGEEKVESLQTLVQPFNCSHVSNSESSPALSTARGYRTQSICIFIYLCCSH